MHLLESSKLYKLTNFHMQMVIITESISNKIKAAKDSMDQHGLAVFVEVMFQDLRKTAVINAAINNFTGSINKNG